MKKTEICLHCGDDYVPKRRGAQKFCSNSCRSRHWFEKQNKKDLSINTAETLPSTETKPNPSTHVEAMSLAGVGNATAGAAIVEIGKTIFTAKKNKPATKKDIDELKQLLVNRYFPVNNMAQDHLGRTPHYDIETGNIIYLYKK